MRKALGRVSGAEVLDADVGRATVRAADDASPAIRGAIEAAGFELRALHERA